MSWKIYCVCDGNGRTNAEITTHRLSVVLHSTYSDTILCAMPKLLMPWCHVCEGIFRLMQTQYIIVSRTVEKLKKEENKCTTKESNIVCSIQSNSTFMCLMCLLQTHAQHNNLLNQQLKKIQTICTTAQLDSCARDEIEWDGLSLFNIVIVSPLSKYAGN